MSEMMENEITALVVDAAVSVHSTLGPGLFEVVYEACLEHELKKRGLTVQRQVPISVVYDSMQLEGCLCGGPDCQRQGDCGIEID